MTHSDQLIRPRRSGRCRFGISLIEVIACTAIVAVLIVPIAGVIRASGQSIARAGNASTEAKLRGGLRWLRETVRDSDVLTVTSRRLVLRLSSGDTATLQVRSRQLVLNDGRSEIVLLENIQRVAFGQLTQTVPPRSLIGITMQLIARDPQTGLLVSVDAVVSLPPQT